MKRGICPFIQRYNESIDCLQNKCTLFIELPDRTEKCIFILIKDKLDLIEKNTSGLNVT